MYQSIPKLEMKGWGPSLIHALGYNTTLFAGQSEGSYVLIFVPKILADFYYDLIEKQWLAVIVYSSRLELTS